MKEELVRLDKNIKTPIIFWILNIRKIRKCPSCKTSAQKKFYPQFHYTISMQKKKSPIGMSEKSQLNTERKLILMINPYDILNLDSQKKQKKKTKSAENQEISCGLSPHVSYEILIK